MSKGAVTLMAIMGLGLAGTAFASSRGMGVPSPEPKPISIREGSARGNATGNSSRRYRTVFIGGGIYHGK